MGLIWAFTANPYKFPPRPLWQDFSGEGRIRYPSHMWHFWRFVDKVRSWHVSRHCVEKRQGLADPALAAADFPLLFGLFLSYPSKNHRARETGQ